MHNITRRVCYVQKTMTHLYVELHFLLEVHDGIVLAGLNHKG